MTQANPYAPPAASAVAGPPIDTTALGELVEQHTVGQERSPLTRWTVSFHASQLVLERGDGRRWALSRQDVVAHTDLVIGAFLNALAVRRDDRVMLPLPSPALAALRRFIEPVAREHCAEALKRRVKLSLPFGVIALATALPMFGLALSMPGVVVGGAMILLALATSLVRHRSMFLADALVWLLIVANNAIQLTNGGSTFLFAAFGALGVVLAIGSLRYYAFYAPPR